jgi:hypothetical protein
MCPQRLHQGALGSAAGSTKPAQRQPGSLHGPQSSAIRTFLGTISCRRRLEAAPPIGVNPAARHRRSSATALVGALLAASAVAACQPVQPDRLPPLRDRNYLCQMPGPNDTHEDEVACEDNKRPLMER